MDRRVLLVSSNSSERGGGERFLIYLTLGLRRLGTEVHVLLSTVPYMDGWATALGDVGAIVERENLKGLRDRRFRFVGALADGRQRARIANVCRSLSPDLILVSQQYDEDGLEYLAGALDAGVAPVCGFMHMPMTYNKNRRPLGRLRGAVLSRWYSAHPYKLILPSSGGQQEFESYYPAPRPTRVVHHGCVFIDRKIAARSPFPTSGYQGGPIIAFAGQLVFQKNIPLLLDAWLLANARGAACRLLLIGDGPDRGMIEERLRGEAPAGTWHIAGWQSDPGPYLALADLYIMTSRFEGLPLALIEAAGSGIPCVVTPFNGALDVAEKASWVKIAADHSSSSVAKTLEHVLAHLAAFRAEAAAGSEDFRAHFSPERMARDVLDEALPC